MTNSSLEISMLQTSQIENQLPTYHSYHNPYDGNISATVIPIMTPICIHCQRVISPDAGLFYAIPAPYYAVIHKECAPFFQYRNQWPHREPWEFYSKKICHS